MEQPSFGFDEEEPEATTFSVVELNSRVRDSLRRGFPDEVWVRGEVQNLSTSSAGHTYFALVEKAGRGDRVQGRLDVALFRDDRRAVARALADVPGAELGNDVEVRIRGRVTVYPNLNPGYNYPMVASTWAGYDNWGASAFGVYRPGTAGSITYSNYMQGDNAMSGSMSGGMSGATTNGGGGAHNHSIVMAIQYIDLILASKN